MMPVIDIQRHGSEGLGMMVTYPHAQHILFPCSPLAIWLVLKKVISTNALAHTMNKSWKRTLDMR